jgi:hypothetical protein
MLGIGLAAAVLAGGPLGILLFQAGRQPLQNRLRRRWCWAGP